MSDERPHPIVLSTAPYYQTERFAERLPGVELVIFPFDPKLSPDEYRLAFYQKAAEVNPDAIQLKYPTYPYLMREFFEEFCPPNLKLVSIFAAGFDMVDVAAARERGVHASNCTGCVHEATAETALWHIISCLRKFPYHIASGLNGTWKDLRVFGCGLSSRTLGIVGLGEIGTQTARLAHCLGMKIAYTKRTRLDPEKEAELGFSPTFYPSLAELLPVCDVVSIHVPLSESTHHMFSTAEFAQMNPTAYLVNTSRGGVVDEEALLVALREKTIAGAGLDVFEEEPCPGERMRELSELGCSVTPHLGGHCSDVGEKLERRSIENLRCVLVEGGEPVDLVN